MKKSISRSALIPLAVFIISAVCLLPAVSPSAKSPANPFAGTRASGQRAGCEAAVKRVQKAVTEEAYAFVAERRAGCQLASLPADSRAGKPQAIYKLTQQKYEEARQEVAAAYRAAGDCSASGIAKPRVVETAENYAASYLICMEGGRVPCSGLQPGDFNRCEEENKRRRDAREGTCAHLIEKLDCESLHVVDDRKPPDAGATVEEVVTVPDDLDPKCREAYLQFKAAEKEQERAQKRAAELAPTFGGAGPRGQVLYDRARADSRSAGLKRYDAEQKLKTCQGLAAADGEQPGGTKAGYIGCYKDPNKPFDLDGYLVRSQNNTPQRCIETCRDKGFAYAGVQYGESCLCGNSYGRFGEATNCNMKCTGDSGQICGGTYSNSVYATQ